jgi:hypothetical protein
MLLQYVCLLCDVLFNAAVNVCLWCNVLFNAAVLYIFGIISPDFREASAIWHREGLHWWIEA